MPNMPHRLLVLALLPACAPTLKSPTPTTTSVSPELACNDQLTTTITVAGDAFTPVPSGVLTDEASLALPSVALTYVSTLAGGTVVASTVAVDSTTRWIDAQTMAFDVTPPLGLDAGVYDVAVTNVDGQVATLPASFVATSPPVTSGIAPDLVCVDQEDTEVVVSGDFHVIEGVSPTLRVGELDLTPTAMEDCVDFVGPVEGASCTTLRATIPTGALLPAVYPVAVIDPATSTCISIDDVRVEVIGAPVLDAIAPDLECIDEAAQGFTLTGQGFLQLRDGTLPTVAFGAYSAAADSLADCTDLEGPAGGQLCTTLHFTLPVDAVAPGVADVVVTNPAPADCHTEEPVQAETVPAPTIASVDPGAACTDDGPRVLTLAGEGFVVLADGTMPSVHIDDVTLPGDPGSATGCTALLGPAGGESCTGMTVTVPTDAVAAGLHAVTVQNPETAECSTPVSVPFEVVAGPVLTGAEPILACDDEGDTIYTLSGTDFTTVDGAFPVVAIGGWSGVASGVSGCVPLEGSLAGERCTELTVTVPQGALADGTLPVSVTNPDPVGCSTDDAVTVDVIGAPTVASLDPASVCDEAGAFTLTLHGADFAFVDGVGPTVTIAGTPWAVAGSAGCTTLTTSGAQVCTELLIDIPAGAFPTDGSYAVSVQNPEPVACTSPTEAVLEVSGPPTIASVEPDEVCETGATVTITGERFAASAVVTVGGMVVSSTWVDESTIIADTTGVPAGTWDVTVTNPDGCEATATAALTIDPPPIVFYVDPPVTYSGVAMRATIYVSGVNHDVVDVHLVDASGASTPLDFTWDADRSYRILATLPAGLADGTYSVVVTDGVDCDASLDDAVEVVSELTVALGELDPPFGYTGDSTAVNVNTTDPLPSGEVPFEEMPRVYLSPHVVDADSVATELSALTFTSESQLDAVVPDGLDVGDYDALVINPDGSIGLLEAAFEVTADPVPVIQSVSPASVDNSTDHDVTVSGAAFRDAVVDFECVDYSSGATTNVTGTVVGSATGDTLTVTFPSTTLSPGVCLVTATNSDGTWATYASISVTSPSANLDGFTPGPEMSVGRRAPAAAAGRATRTARYLYAIGGDDGSSAGALDSVEAIDVGVYGDLGAWETLPGTLPAPRTLAGVGSVGRFVYLAGGNDGAGAVDTVLRAQVLDPVETPSIEDLVLDYADAGGVPGGTWIYRIAALYPASYTSNPGGESLPGDPLVVRLPSVADGFEVTLTWTSDPDASGYRVYRSPAADAGSGAEEWLADVTTTTFTDDGTYTTDPSHLPLPKGALGEWATVATLPDAVEAPCVAVGEDPTVEGGWYLYVAGGRDGSGVVRDDIQVIGITEEGEHAQAVDAVATSVSSLSTPRWQCGGFRVHADLDSVVTGRTNWVYFGGGLTTGGTVSGAVDAGLVGDGGDFADFLAVDTMRGSAGYGYAAASNFLYAFGGSNASPSTDGTSAEICGSSGDPGCSRSPVDPPDLRNWNSLGLSLNEARYLPGSAQESSVIFLVGGETDADAASTTVEWTNF